MPLESYLFFVLVFSTVESQRRIFGGKDAEEGQLPYAVYLHIRGLGSCTGSIIHEQWVISASHCVTDNEGEQIQSYRINITAGTVDYRRIRKAQFRTAIKVIRHSGYESAIGKHDISLIRVDRPFEFGKYVQKIEFRTSPWPQDDKGEWGNCLSAGWGLTDKGRTSRIQFLKTNAEHGRGTCPCIEHFYVLKRIVCLPHIDGEGICFGDSGGALVCEGNIVGIAHVVMDKRSCSYKKSPAKNIDCGSKYVYGIYMYTCPYLDWISSNVPGVPSKPESCEGIISRRPQDKITIIFIAVIISALGTL